MQMQLNILPPILIVNFKRFKEGKTHDFYSMFKNQSRMGVMNHQKDNTFVDFPIDGLDMTRFVKDKKGEQHVYDLYAVSNHSGTLDFGHYTAVCKNHKDGKWYSFNDSSWRQIPTSDVKSSNSLVLFYRRRGLTTFPGKVNFYDLAKKPNSVYL